MARTKKNQVQELRFDEKLVLFKFMQRELGITDMKQLARQMNLPEEEGINESTGNTLFIEYFFKQPGCRIPETKLRVYDENIRRYTQKIGENRGGLTWKYFQYLSLLFTEIYLDRWFSDKEAFQQELTDFLHDEDDHTLGQIGFQDFDLAKMNKLAYMSATGSGKTLILHVNILQFSYYLKRAKRINASIDINNVILLTPNEGMSRQHLEELKISGIPAKIFVKEGPLKFDGNEVLIIDINKLDDVGKDKTVSVDSFETNNLLLVDEGHRGLVGGEKWVGYRQKMAEDGFTFEYSATFKQALAGKKTKKKDRDIVEDYQKAILFDYSYKYFYNDGYGKDYRIYNLKDTNISEDSRLLYLTGCLLSFYQQKKCFLEYGKELAPFRIENPLLVFVGNSVNKANKDESLTDVEDVIMFIDQFVRYKRQTVQRINLVVQQNTGLIDAKGIDIFSHDFNPLYELNGGNTPDGQVLFEDILHLLFNTTSHADEPRLHLDHLSKAGEIGMRIGEDGDYFGVISIGDTTKLIKSCETKGVVTKSESFNNDSLFESINRKDSKINVLIGSRKFTEGWNSWRVSTMGLINFAKGEGSQAIQMFGRGVRLKGYNGMLKRSRAINIPGVQAPKYIGKLETLTIFGVKANYMEEFKAFLELEDVPSNDQITEITLPTVSRYQEAKAKKLRVIRVKSGKIFKRDAERKLLDKPSEKFKSYLMKNPILLDCRSKVQAIESSGSIDMRIEVNNKPIDMPEVNIPLLDYYRIFDEIEMYKNEKLYFNITIDRDRLPSILGDREWYQYIVPADHLKIDSIKRREEVTDFAIMALKIYMDRFFKFEKQAWEDKYLEYGELEATDNNFVDEYRINLTEEVGGDCGEELNRFISDAATILATDRGISEYEKSTLAKQFVLFDFRHHLYAPLVCVKKNNLKIQVSPVQLNEDEKTFVDLLDCYMKNHGAEWKDKSLFLLRNKSKVGMGFFEAGNFYPDYILWIDTDDKQYISFIDPKGLMHIMPDDPKIKFYEKIKDLEVRLAPSAGDKQIVLNSFIMSSTRGANLREWWGMKKPSEHEAMNVYTLDDAKCIEKMIQKIFQ